jgi:hypothetical protein
MRRRASGHEGVRMRARVPRMGMRAARQEMTIGSVMGVLSLELWADPPPGRVRAGEMPWGQKTRLG